MAGYNTEKWSLSAGVLNPFTKKYEQEIENLSKSAPYRQLAYSKNLRLLFMVMHPSALTSERSATAKAEESTTGIPIPNLVRKQVIVSLTKSRGPSTN